MALAIHEANIDPTYFIINPDVGDGFLKTCIALHHILDAKLYKVSYPAADDYLKARWKLSRAAGYNFSRAGRIIIQMGKTLGRDKMPCAIGLYLMLDKLHKERNLTHVEIWRKAVQYFGSRQMVIAVKMDEIFEDLPPDSAIDLSGEPGLQLDDTTRTEIDEEIDEDTEIEDVIENERDTNEVDWSSRLRKRKEVTQDTSDEDDSETTKRPNIPISTGFGRSENEYNTPQYLVNLITKFCGEIDLDPCWNPESKIIAKTVYGEQVDGTFVNALTLSDWTKSNWVYLNAPGAAIDAEQHGPKTSAKRPYLHNDFWEKTMLEMKKGNIKRIIAIIPNCPYRKWCRFALARGLCCHLTRKVPWDKTAAAKVRMDDMRFSAKNSHISNDVYSRMIVYIDSDADYPHTDKFIEVFRTHGFIPGLNTRIPRILEISEKRPLRYFSAFAGIGGAEMALRKIFPEAICVGFCETDKDALKVYVEHHPRHKNFGDITKIKTNTIPDFDLLIGGPPCQPFSLANPGKTKFTDPRADLYTQFVRIRNDCQPQYVIMENVPMDSASIAEISKGLLSTTVQKLNAASFCAQNRIRLYWTNFFVPEPLDVPSPTIDSIVEPNHSGKSLHWKCFKQPPPPDLIAAFNKDTVEQTVKFRDDGKSNTIIATECYELAIAANGVFRLLTCSEREKLQGFPVGYTAFVPDKSRKRLLGNAMNVPTIEYILKHIP
ncbi:S-adenosyl-L-methionine-dependent methyltransferase [Fimicolochytrium jonesii]|uniref:S-adenosyl-L-methionine-dependent methyltransferase n=1 Tax=Fimicolochytrium jonesii TaxID=1396493 RepID=UPI0022FDCAE2|nr:S-adenosyl-L-methionine-dependent methyltransferase [Fimicolochytrium jonesii]KAI8815513.1 S-adenosyl-L-methionine-dependent methyltransferase [Fimicolochytrium jonesii]